MKKRILIVDDQEINRDILAGILSKSYEPVVAVNGKEAVEALGEDGNGFALVLLDLVMPEMDGYDVLEHLNENGLIDEMPVIVISAEVDAETERKCLALNVVDFIRKPFDKLAVLRRVENVINLFAIQHNLEKLVDEKTEEIKKQNEKLAQQAACLKRTNERIIELLGTVVEYRNLESGQHIKRVKGFTKLLAEQIAVHGIERQHGGNLCAGDKQIQQDSVQRAGKIDQTESRRNETVLDSHIPSITINLQNT